MKEQAIKKINKIGKISSIVALIGKILVGIGMVCVILVAIVCFVIPKNFISMDVGTTIAVSMNITEFASLYSEEEIDEMLAEAQAEWLEMEQADKRMTEVTDTGVKMTEQHEHFTLDMHDIGGAAIFVAVALAMTFVTLCFISSVCKAFRDCQSPFETNVINKLQKLAYALIPWALVSTISNSISDSLMNNKLSIMVSIDLGVILVVLIVLVLVYIFKYGAVLQQESDETL